MRAGNEFLEEMARSPSVQKRRPAGQHRPPMCRAFARKLLLRTASDRESRLSHDMMAKLALAAAEEHVKRPVGNAGIVALYAKVGWNAAHHASGLLAL